jgi:adenylate cyclase
MLEALSLFNNYQKVMAQQENRDFIEVRVGMGINSGICCVGNMGSTLRFDYSVLGDNVNLASRLEGQAKAYAVNIVISEYTLASMKTAYQDFAILELGIIRVKGKYQPVRIYTVLGDAALARSNAFLRLVAVHSEMMRNYYLQNWQEVLLLITRCQAFNQLELCNFYHIYQQRVESFIVTPPESTWDGVYIATAK